MLYSTAAPYAAIAQSGTAAAPVFSVPRGFYDSAFNLILSSPGASIRYTLDGSTPSPTTGLQYSAPIPVTTSTIVRAVAYSASLAPSPVVTHSYIFLDAVRAQSDSPLPGWPSMFAITDLNGSYPADYGMDPEVLNHPNNSAPGKFETVMKSLPTLSIVTDLPNLWHPATGIYFNPNAKPGTPPMNPDTWERPVSLEWINPDGTTGFGQIAGARIEGETSRRPHRQPKKDFRIAFSATYGTAGLDFQLFDETAPASFDSIVLRNGGNRSWSYFDRDQRREADYINDELARRAWLKMGNLAPHGTYVHLYLNGLYWGLYNVTESLEPEFLQSYLGLTTADYDIVQAGDDAGNYPTATYGTVDAWTQLIDLVSGTDPVNDALYLDIQNRVDLVNLADYIIHAHYIGKTDWPHHNWNAYRQNLGADTRFRFMPLNNDSGLNKVNENNTLLSDMDGDPDAPVFLFQRLTTNPEFIRLLTDRLYKHVVAPNGALTSASCSAMYTELANTIDQAVTAESARWGDYIRDKYPTSNVAPKAFPAYLHSRDLPAAYTDPANAVVDVDQKTWLDVRNEKLTNYCPNRSSNLVNQYTANGWYQVTVNPPTISIPGGMVAANTNVTLTSGSGTIYYTVNGGDPRGTFGVVAPGASAGGASVSVPITQRTTIKARVQNGSNWSPMIEYTFHVAQPFEHLVINEIHYNPASPSTPAGENPNDYEFIELYNKGGSPIRLDYVSFTGGIHYTFPANTTLAAGTFLVLASNPQRFQERYGFAPFGRFGGSLLNSGGTVGLLDPAGTALDTVTYQSTVPWPVGANGSGGSLSLSVPTADNSQPANWFASPINGGTPGKANNNDMGKTLPQITFTAPAAIVYGTPLSAAQLNATVAGNIPGTFSYAPAAGTVLQAGSGQVLRVTFTPNDTQTYAAVNATTFIDVTKAPLTITAENKVRRFGAANPPLTAIYTGFVNGDTVDSLDTPAVLSTTAINSSPVGSYPITVSGASDANYDIAFVDGTLTVTDKTIPTITWSPASLTYGTPLGNAQLNAEALDGPLPVAGTLSYNPPLGTVLQAGQQTLSVTFTPLDTNNYVPVEQSVTINVAKVSLTIRADDKIRQVGKPNPVLTASYTGFVNGDTPASLDLPAVLSTSATIDSPVGTYPITVSGAADANYVITFIDGTLTVTTEPVSQQLMLPMVMAPN